MRISTHRTIRHSEPGRVLDGGEESAVAVLAGSWSEYIPETSVHIVSKAYWVYILASRSRNLYTGVTNSLSRRLAQHRQGLLPGFTLKYKIFRLVHFEAFADIENAIAREKEIKAWRREKKIWLIQKHNPFWRDLAPEGGGRRKRTSETADSSPPSRKRPGSE